MSNQDYSKKLKSV